MPDNRICIITGGGPLATVQAGDLPNAMLGKQIETDIAYYASTKDHLDFDGVSVILRMIDERKYDCTGFVVTAAIEEVCDAAAATAFAIGPAQNFPVVYACAPTGPEHVLGAGLAAIRRAVLAATAPLTETIILDHDELWRGVRARLKYDGRLVVTGYEKDHLGFVGKDGVVLDRWGSRPRSPGTPAIQFRFADVALVKQMPGNDARNLRPLLLHDSKPRGIVLELLGASPTLTNKSYQYDTAQFVAEALQLGIPVVATSASAGVLPPRYSPHSEVLVSGCIPGSNLTRAAAVAKLAVVIELVDSAEYPISGGTRMSAIKTQMMANQLGEMSPVGIAEVGQAFA